MKRLLIITLLWLQLFAQTNWGQPTILSEYSNYPYLRNDYSSIAVDNNGVIFCFWVKLVGDVLDWECNIELRKSYDNGETWTEVENITPNHGKKRITDLNTVCDSSNRIHLFYNVGLGDSESYLGYKIFDGSSWSQTAQLSFRGWNIQPKIDTEDIIFISTNGSYGSYISFHDTDEQNMSIWTMKEKQKYWIIDFTYDKYNNLHTIGSTVDMQWESYRASYSKYDRRRDTWTEPQVIYDFYNKDAFGNSIVMDRNDTLYADISNCNDSIFVSKKNMNDSLWSQPVFIDGPNISKYYHNFLVDNDNNPHLIFNHSAVFSFKQYFYNDNNWELDYIQLNDSSTYSAWASSAYDKKNSLLLACYHQKDSETNNGEVVFNRKFLETGMIDSDGNLPRTAELYQNYPNPFNPATNIRFALSRPDKVELTVYNVLGQFVKKLADQDFVEGYHSVRFEADDLNSGVYYYRLKAEGKELTKKMLLVK
jgi:hypothetical protein